MAIRLYDSLSREVRELKPAQPDGVFRMYCCGPTVYAPAHIGNFRTFLVQDVLRRLLELELGPGKVKHVRNLTDVDDRTIAQAKREKRPLAEITREWTDIFHNDCRALNILPMDPPHVEPKATEHIPEQVEMINELLAKGLAYVAPDGSVYYKIAAFPRYGALSRLKERELKATVLGADDDHKDDASDFALWKAYKPDEDGEVKWPGPRGAAAGRPGWHIECSAMSRKYLGDTLDLHAGGEDLEFPHHENEIAQSEGCTGHTFSRHWYHTKHLLVDGTTMSKSKGNYYTVGDLLEKGYSPMAIRYALLAGHPRKQLNFTLDSLHAAESAIRTLRSIPAIFNEPRNVRDGDKPSKKFQPIFDALCDDLNIPAAFGALFELRQEIAYPTTGKPTRGDIDAFSRVLFALGLDLSAPPKETSTPAEISALADKRWAARLAKDFKTADALRKELAAAGWSMLDGKDGYKLEPLKK
ncbi:MAG TPA: cysteine--tRNA ligase [Alphaproteobacteria bacterium]|nr:cysteine--tRNA ligase [Alphaproteobacteria bacterium]HTT55560.1 cysteine--tRNA ligase [Opitutaceae bacterium]